MAHRMEKAFDKPIEGRQERADKSAVVADGAAALHVVPLKISPLLSPYRKHGRLSLRIERMPQLSRLSAGRNNGNGSWSLGGDELDDLTYMVPEGAGDHTLAIRVISVDRSAGNTLAVLEYLVSPGLAAPSSAQPAPMPANTGSAGDAPLQRLRDELALVKATLATRDAQLAKAQQKAELTELALSKHKSDTELAVARADWKAELDERLAAAVSQSAIDFQQQRAAWEAELSARTAKLEERALERLLEARERWQKEADERLLKAEQDWKAEEAVRSAAAQAEWQDKLSKARTGAGRAGTSEAELRDLHATLASLKTKLADRDAALAEARAGIEEERERLRRQTEAELLKAEQSWKAKETARLLAAEKEWRAKSAAMQDRAGQNMHETERGRLREEIAQLKSALSDREAALAHALAAVDEARKGGKGATLEAIAEAERAWKAQEAERVAATEARWRGYSETTIAEAVRRCEAAEDALAQLRLEIEATHNTADATPLPKTRIVLQTNSAWEKAHAEEILQTKRKTDSARSLVRDAIVAAALSASAIFLYPSLEPYLPSALRLTHAATAMPEPAAPAAQVEPAPSTEAAPAPVPPAAAPRIMIAMQDANVRANPATTASIVSRLRRGTAVTQLELRGNWVHVQISGGEGKNEPQQGWVHASLLRESAGASGN